MRSCRARSSSRLKAWFNGRAEPRRVRRAVRALVTPSIWMARKTSLLPSDLRGDTNTERVSLTSQSVIWDYRKIWFFDYKLKLQEVCKHKNWRTEVKVGTSWWLLEQRKDEPGHLWFILFLVTFFKRILVSLLRSINQLFLFKPNVSSSLKKSLWL